jgi:hypothetical protein
VKDFSFVLLLGATTYSSAACLFLNIRLIPFSPVVVYIAQISIVPGIVAFARKSTTANRENMKPQTVIGTNGSWNDRRNGSAHILDIVDSGAEGLSTARLFKR